MALKIEIHPAAECMPKMAVKEYREFAADVEARGFEEQIRYIELDGKASIYDGRHRFQVCGEKKIDPWKAKTISGEPLMLKVSIPKDETPYEFICSSVKSLNINRRQMTSAAQKATAAAKLLKWMHEEHRKANPDTEPETNGKAKKVKIKNKKHKSKAKGEANATARGAAAEMTGASPRNVSNAAELQEHAPHLFKQVDAGDLSINKAIKLYKEEKATERMTEASKTAAKQAVDIPILQEFRVTDCLEGFKQIKAGSVNLIITDPPYNEGIDYGKGAKADKRDPEAYYDWITEWLKACSSALHKHGSMILIVPSQHAAECDLILESKSVGLHIRARLIWYETFGQSLQDNFGKCHRNMFYVVKDRKKFTWNREPFLVESARQQLGDKRAAPEGKIMDSVIKVPRLVGNAKERIEIFPTQLPMALLQPFVDGLSMPGDMVVDPFAGSGTTAECCLWAENGQRKFLGFDLNDLYTTAAITRLTNARKRFGKQEAE